MEAKQPYEKLLSPGEKEVSKVSMGASVLNLVKVVVGAGAFSLPQGVASFSDEPGPGLALGLLVMVLLSSISAYSFWLIGRMCAATNESTYTGAFGAVFGRSKRWLVSVCSSVFCGTFSMIYCIVIADNSRDLALGLGFTGLVTSRSALVVTLGLLVLLPLSLLRSLAALAPFSALGLLGMLYTDGFCGLRWWQGGYEPGGEFFEQVEWKPTFDSVPPRALPAFVLISMLATAFIGHFSAPRFWNELERPTLKRFAALTAMGFLGAQLTMGSVMVFGFLTFGSASQGLVLNNYAVTDQLATLSRFGIVSSIVCSYPFVVTTCRDDFLQLAVPGGPSQRLKTATTVLINVVAVAVALAFDNLGFLVALVGALLATALVYLFPAAMLVGFMRPRLRSGQATAGERCEFCFNVGLLALGIMVSMLGTVVTFLQYFWPETLLAKPS